jgi:hypothetical protein
MVVLGIAIFGLCAVLIALGMTLESFSEFFLRHGQVFFKILGGLQWGLGSISIAAIGMAFWRLALRAGFQQVRLETAGVHFRLGTTKKPSRRFLRGTRSAWSFTSNDPTINTLSSRTKAADR